MIQRKKTKQLTCCTLLLSLLLSYSSCSSLVISSSSQNFIRSVTPQIKRKKEKEKEKGSKSDFLVSYVPHLPLYPPPLILISHNYPSLSLAGYRLYTLFFFFIFSQVQQTLLSHSLIISHRCTSFITISTIIFLVRSLKNP